ncbi:FkbM family methyltransferase [Rhizocola hellebori]|nr:FkbM family methyltransferase [Rhizocola hellebori]
MGAARLGMRLAETGAYATGQVLRLFWPVRAPSRPERGFLCLSDRIALLRATVSNWPLLAVDRIAPRGTELTYRTVNGRRVHCRARTSDLLETVIVSSGFEYPVEHLRIDDDHPVVVDVGAHIGTFALLMDSLLGDRPYRGVALEPMAENFALLQENLRANRVTGFTTVQAAAACAAGEGFLRTRGQPDTAFLDPRADEGERVRTVELGELCHTMGLDCISLLKMDIEGGEHDVLAASWPFVAERVKVIVLEFHEDGPGRDLESLHMLLEPAFTIKVLHRGPTQGVLIARAHEAGEHVGG